MTQALFKMLGRETNKLKQAGLYKDQIAAPGPDSAEARVDLTQADYLGLAVHERVQAAAAAALARYGGGHFGSPALSANLPIYGELEAQIARFFDADAALIFSNGYLGNLGVFDCLFDHRDAIFCDAWVHPSLAEGVRLSSATAIPYRNDDVDELEDKLKRSRAARFRVIVTNGVFATSGRIARLQDVCQIAERYEALVVVDDSLGVGVLGAEGRGSLERGAVMSRVHIVTGSWGPVLGAVGGYVAGRAEVIEWLRQKSTAYLFSESPPPVMIETAKTAWDLVRQQQTPKDDLQHRWTALRDGLSKQGFRILGGDHPLFSVVVGEVIVLQKMVNALHARGVDVHGLCYPVVPQREARIRLQVSVRHTDDQIARALTEFEAAGRGLGVI